MKYILDTNTLSYLMKGDAAVSRRLLAQARTDVLLPQPVVAEIEYGLDRLPRSARKRRLAERFRIFAAELERADWSDAVSHSFGRIKASLERRGLPLKDFEIAVAAHALALEATLVTSNLDHFRRISKLRVESWTGR